MPITCDGEYGYLFMQELKLPEAREKSQAAYKQFGERIHWVDGNNIPGAFQMNTCWWYRPMPKRDPAEAAAAKGGVGAPHHHPYPEILGFYGSDPENPWELNGEVEFWVNGEQHILTRSTMVFLPPNMPHCPLSVNRVDKPIFHLSVVMNSIYTTSDEQGTYEVV